MLISHRRFIVAGALLLVTSAAIQVFFPVIQLNLMSDGLASAQDVLIVMNSAGALIIGILTPLGTALLAVGIVLWQLRKAETTSVDEGNAGSADPPTRSRSTRRRPRDPWDRSSGPGSEAER